VSNSNELIQKLKENSNKISYIEDSLTPSFSWAFAANSAGLKGKEEEQDSGINSIQFVPWQHHHYTKSLTVCFLLWNNELWLHSHQQLWQHPWRIDQCQPSG